MKDRFGLLAFLTPFFVTILGIAAAGSCSARADQPAPILLAKGWQIEDASRVTQGGAEVSTASYNAAEWLSATVPGTALTSLVNNHLYPEPLYGENDRPEVIPDSLAHASWWYRTVVVVPASYAQHHIWLNFDGINYSAAVWVNGVQVGEMRGAFVRGVFDISSVAKAGESAVIAVLVSPQPHSGVPHEHTLRQGVGSNGGESAIDGPTFFSTIGWDWLPAIRDRDTGIWQRVFLSASGPVLIKNPLVTTDLPLPRTDSAEIGVQATVENVTDDPVSGYLKGTIENIQFQRQVSIAAHGTLHVIFNAANTPALNIERPRLWWPNGYGPQNLYTLHLSFSVASEISDAQDVHFGVRKISYTAPSSDTLTISVNGVPVFIRGGDWGLDEAMKRIPRERLEAEIRLHKLANLNMIRNWAGQSTSEDFYELCDKYGILVWDEFFEVNPGDGPDPTDIATYIANARDKILRFRNHPAIAVWCARNEGNPPPQIDAELRKMMSELDPERRYQASSADGGGVRSSGPYNWRAPREFYTITDDFFKTESGSVSIPTLESIHSMMPWKDWEVINDDWAEHDLAKSASGGGEYAAILATRYGKILNLADFVRKAQLANFEAFRAMFEGRNAQMFHPATGLITWMSNPAHPSFVWQIYAYDLEPMSSYYAVMHAAEPVHIQYNETNGQIEIVNNRPQEITGALARILIYNLDGTLALKREIKTSAGPEAATDLGKVEFPSVPSPVYFLKLELVGGSGKPISENFYWCGQTERPDDLAVLNQLPTVALSARAQRVDANGNTTITVTLRNSTSNIALMAHLQLRRHSGERVLPAYATDNYVTLVPNETKTIKITAASADFHGEGALVAIDGWNVTATPASFGGVAIAPNIEAQPDHWPASGLPFETIGLR